MAFFRPLKMTFIQPVCLIYGLILALSFNLKCSLGFRQLWNPIRGCRQWLRVGHLRVTGQKSFHWIKLIHKVITQQISSINISNLFICQINNMRKNNSGGETPKTCNTDPDREIFCRPDPDSFFISRVRVGSGFGSIEKKVEGT